MAVGLTGSREHILMYIKLTCVNQLRLRFISAITHIRPLKAGQQVPDCAAGLFVENLISACSLALFRSLSLSHFHNSLLLEPDDGAAAIRALLRSRRY